MYLMMFICEALLVEVFFFISIYERILYQIFFQKILKIQFLFFLFKKNVFKIRIVSKSAIKMIFILFLNKNLIFSHSTGDGKKKHFLYFIWVFNIFQI